MTISGTTPTLDSRAATSDDTSSTSSSTSSGTEQMFLQLLVAQLKNQDPMNPADGMQFVTQLAQFSQLEQSIAMREDLDTLAGAVSAE
jgi:flagellar basal-body rod modification protein FlgD